MTRGRIIFACGALLGLLLLVSAPARLLNVWLPEQTLRLEGYSGSIWRGSASSALLAVDGGWLQLGELQWRLALRSLPLLSPRVEIQSSWGPQHLSANVQLYPNGSLRLHQASVSFDAGLIKQWLPIQLGGALQLRVNDVDIVAGELLSGRGQLVWQRAFWTGNNSSQLLGDYVLEFVLQGARTASANITTLAGPVQVEGSLAVREKSYSVDARLSSAQGFGSELASALQLMAAPVPGGYHLKFSGEF